MLASSAMAKLELTVAGAAVSAYRLRCYASAATSPNLFPLLGEAFERNTAAGGRLLWSDRKGTKHRQDAARVPGAPSAALAAAYCYVSIPRSRRGVCLADLSSLIALMRFRDSAGLKPVIVLGDGSAASDVDSAVACDSENDDCIIEKLAAGVDKLFQHHEEVVQKPLPKLRIHRNSEWYKANIIEFLAQAGRPFRVEDLYLRAHLQTDSSGPSSASLSAFSSGILEAHDWQQICRLYGPSVQVDSGRGRHIGLRTRSMQLALDHLQSENGQHCLGILLAPLHTPPKVPAAGSCGSSVALPPGPVAFDAQLADCYEIYQHLLSVADSQLEQHLWLLSVDSTVKVREVLRLSQERPESRIGQHHLASQLVSLLFGGDAPMKVKLASDLLFRRDRPLRLASSNELDAVRFCVRSHRMPYVDGITLLDVLVHSNCFEERGPAKSNSSVNSTRLKSLGTQVLHHEGFTVNGVAVKENRRVLREDMLASGFTVLGRGRRTYRIIEWE